MSISAAARAISSFCSPSGPNVGISLRCVLDASYSRLGRMRKLAGITVGIMTALGGFIDFGQFVFTLQGRISFRYALLWSVVLGTVAIIVYMEMCGRIAVIAREPVFAVVRHRLGKRLGFALLIASNLLNLITFAAELGGVAIPLRSLTGWPENLCWRVRR